MVAAGGAGSGPPLPPPRRAVEVTTENQQGGAHASPALPACCALPLCAVLLLPWLPRFACQGDTSSAAWPGGSLCLRILGIVWLLLLVLVVWGPFAHHTHISDGRPCVPDLFPFLVVCHTPRNMWSLPVCTAAPPQHFLDAPDLSATQHTPPTFSRAQASAAVVHCGARTEQRAPCHSQLAQHSGSQVQVRKRDNLQHIPTIAQAGVMTLLAG